MLLAIDIGNTNTVLGVFDGEKLERSWRIKTDARSTADELALTFRGLLTDHEITGTAACSTVPAALRELRVMLAAYYAHLPTVLVEPGVRTGVSLQYDNPKEVGADRIWEIFRAEYLAQESPLKLNSVHTSSAAGEKDALTVNVYVDGELRTLEGTGNGPIAAFVDAINTAGEESGHDWDVRVLDYAEHALSSGGDALAAAYVECSIGSEIFWGVGIDANIVTASLKAVISAVNRAR